MTLTPAQIKAVKYNSGPLLVIAGAGTGKTTVLTEKISYLINEKRVKPENILALTFTEKAATEMEERVDRALPYGYFQTHISTFHSFCDSILRDESIHIKFSPNYTLLTETESIIFFKKYLFHLPLNQYRPPHNPTKFIQGLLTHFSRLKDEDINPHDYKEWTKKQSFESDDEKHSYEELANVYEEYETLKHKEQIMDFSDLICTTLHLFRSKPGILSSYKQKYQYILVDEFQDTNIAQYELVKLLAPPQEKPHLTVIGDDNQSIYKFRGASVSNILSFMKDYQKAKVVVLNDNFRSAPHILTSSYRLIKHNDPDTLESRLKISKKLTPHIESSDRDQVYFHIHQTELEENTFIANTIKDLVSNESFEWKDITILVRAHNHADSLNRALSTSNIPAYFSGSGVLLKEPEIKELIAYLFFLSDVHDSTSLYRVLTSRYSSCDVQDIHQLISFSKKTSRSLFDAVRMHVSWFFENQNPEEYKPYRQHAQLLSNTSIKTLSKLYSLFKKQLNDLHHNNITGIIYEFLDKTGKLKELLNPKTSRDEKITLNITSFFHMLQRIQNNLSESSLLNVVDYLRMSLELGDSPLTDGEEPIEYNAVKIMTVHSAKGLEFPVVFIPSLTSLRFPTRNRKDQIPLHDSIIKEILPVGNSHEQEERRLFYVALTRAKKRVYLSSAKRYSENKRTQKISPFVYETMGEAFMKLLTKNQENVKQQLTLFDFGKQTSSETIFIRPPKPINSISYTQIQTFESCPLKYKYQFILRIPIPPSSSASLGSSVHKTLNLFYRGIKEKKESDMSILKTIFDASWIPIGYDSLTAERKSKEYAWNMIQNFIKTHHKEPVRIKDTEKVFNVKIDDIKIVGIIDRVDEENGRLEIIDYKTGAKPEEKKLQKDIQLSLYTYAAMQKSLYHTPLDAITVTYYYLQDNEKVSFKKTENDIEEMKEKVRKTVKEINESSFPPKKSELCKYCPFKINCEAWQ